ncbi:mitochondrial chaperone bcs1 [Diaporthe amygdali]|uniref:mitochondrial chaperone bcs1 n=1 Tax=Phomopsis amygdali TaxID=1214568 RepID=UPI0022FE2DCA|nr:mitochondrial chaperone bcs1 [Diaporthe amygdali]KAJ0119448.1 mitochondrial chaperone bcs1 [Diaporthe amygdali]
MDPETLGAFGAPAPQFAILDMFFPGFSTFSSAVEKYFKVDLNLYIPLVIFLGSVTFAWRYFSEYFWEKLEAYFMSTVDIRTDDEIYNMLMAWVAQQQFAKGARRFVVNTNLNSRAWYLWRWDEDEDDGPEEGDDSSAQNGKKKKALAYTPTFGSHFFWYKGRICIFRRDKGRDQQAGFMLVSEREEISISCFGRDPWLLKELLLEARTQFTQRDEHKTLIYRGMIPAGTTTPTWQRCLARASRPFSTVILNDKVKQDLIDDVQDYLNPATRRWYSNRGIPYRRGYLLYGPPGTGKSSLSLALAGFFKMRIYIVSLSSVTSNEENLSTLFAELPRRCVVLLEDIDTAGLTHTREDNKPKETNDDNKDDEMEPGQLTKGTGPTNNNNNNNNGRLSLSGLLNILDGVASQEGRVLIMTTNHVDKLDKALIRPGRVDMIVKFDLADTGMISSIFRAIFAPLEGDDKPADAEAEALRDPEDVKRRVAADKARRDDITAQIEQLAGEFAARIPAHEFSPAELQGYLLKNKRDAEGAVRGAEEWVVQARKDKAAKQLKDAEDKRKQEEEDKKAKEEADKKKKEEEEKDKKKNKKKGGKSKKKDRKGKKESSSESDSDSSGDSSSESESEAEAKKDKEKRSKNKGKTDVKIKIDGVKSEQGLLTPASAATEKSDGFVDIEKDCVDDEGRPRTRGTDSGYGTP